MTSLSGIAAPPATWLDITVVNRALRYFAGACLLIAPFVPDPLLFAVGAATLPLLVGIVTKFNGPPVAAYFIFVTWLQIFAPVLVSVTDGESLLDGIWSGDLVRAYWYSLSASVALAIGVRLGIGVLPSPPFESEERGSPIWEPSTLFWLYVGSGVFAAVASRVAIGGLAQPLTVFSLVKSMMLFVVCRQALSSGRGGRWVVAAFVIEIIVGFSGYFSDFKECFVVLGLAALSARIRLSFTTIAASVGMASILTLLLLFWTAVKTEYREYASGYQQAQAISAPIGERFAWLLGRATSPSEIDWGLASEQLLRRIAYIDLFAATINFNSITHRDVAFQQWRDALTHVTQPRLFFPNKPVVDDTSVYMELIGLQDVDAELRGTSISVGYMAESFVDFGFPGMLVPIFAMGVVLGLMLGYFFALHLNPMAREGLAVAFLLALSYGISVALPKMLGPMVMNFALLAAFAKLVFPWLEKRMFSPSRSGNE